VPFIARYRKAQTGGLDEEEIRSVQKALAYFTELEDRKQTVLAAIREQDKLTPELEAQIRNCLDANVLEDLYLPYKKKRKTKAMVAREQGLEPLATLLLTATSGDTEALCRQFVKGEVFTPKEALTGAKYIIAEGIAEDAELRAHVRQIFQRDAQVASKKRDTDHKEAHKFELYFDFAFDAARLKPHQFLALERGEALGILSVSLRADEETVVAQIVKRRAVKDTLLFYADVVDAIRLGAKNYLLPSLERELRNALKEEADKHAVKVFAENLRSLLLQPPLLGKTILGIDPGFASGCKLVVLSPQGLPQESTVMYPVPPRNDFAGAERTLLALVNKHRVDVVAIGNGTASRETEQFVAGVIRKHSLACKYLIVNEAGASVYSASEIARKEFPSLDATERGTISIARRVIDPLAELIKIDPKSIGVGLYQHDVNQRMLAEELEAVVESAVNQVGVDLNTASAPLLARVSGLNARIAENIVEHRARIGAFRRREQLLEVKGVGEKVFEQAAGFLRIREGENPLDNTAIHPEAYPAVAQLAQATKLAAEGNKLPLQKLALALKQLDKKRTDELCRTVNLDVHTFALIQENLAKPGRDPREDVPAPILRSDVLQLADLREGMTLQGTVRNVVDFGAFVDIGLKNDALLHISQLAPLNQGRRVKSPLDVLAVGDVLTVTIASIDAAKGRVGLGLPGK
jgi:uncharacterized protein